MYAHTSLATEIKQYLLWSFNFFRVNDIRLISHNDKCIFKLNQIKRVLGFASKYPIFVLN